MKSAVLPASLALLLTAGCAAPGPFPSLAPREVERIYAAGDPLQSAPEAPDRAGLAERIVALSAAASDGEAAFDRALAAARPLASRAGSPGSESWIAAQQAISRAEAARAQTMRALADLDQFTLEQAREGPLSPGDYRRLTDSAARLQAISGRQQEAMNGLRASVSGR
jgi:hypothetical protein